MCRRTVFGTLGRLYPKADWAPRVFRAKDHLPGAGARRGGSLFPFRLDSARPDARGLVQPQVARRAGRLWRAAGVRPACCERGTDDALGLIQYLDLKTYLVGDINTKVDRASMAHSLEVRDPLMDHELVEWAATLPSDFKIRGQQSKYLMKKSMEPYLPERCAVPAQDGLLGAAWRAGSGGR